jgi:putative ABC transport system permease protein
VLIYRGLLCLYPRAFRQRYGAEITRAIADRHRAAAAAGRLSLLMFHAGALRDMVANAVAERIAVRGARARRGSVGEWAPSVYQDARHAARILRRTPGLTILSALTLALGVGSVAAVASLVDAVLVQPLPFPRPAEVVAIRGLLDGQNAGISYENLRDIGERATRLQAWSPFFAQSVNLTGVREPDRLRGGFVRSGFFEVVGVRAALGRTFGPEADAPGSERLAVLTDGAWRQRFAGRPDIVGQPIQLNNQVFTVAGVLPASFRFPIDYADVYLPFWATTAGIGRDNHNYLAIGRLATSAMLADASAEVAALAAGLESAYLQVNRGRRARLEPLQKTLVADTTYALQLLGAIAAIMLVAGCANVAGLQLGSLASRRREIAVRAALGAGRRRIARQIVLESLARATIGAMLGLAAASAGVRFLVSRAPQDVYGLDRVEIGLFPLAAGLLASLVAGLAAGLPAAIGWARDGGLAVIGAGDRSVGDRRSSRLRGTLVICQVAMASVLLVGASLTTRSFASLTSVDVGFDPDQVLTMEYRVPRNKYASADAQQAFHEQVVARVRAVPGVVDAAGVRALPFSGNGSFFGFRTAAAGEATRASFNAVSHDYFRTLRIPLLAGRTFEPGDRRELVVVVSRSLADREWPGASALGRTLYFDGVGTATVIGVVGDVRHRELAESSLAAVYTLQTQNPSVFNTLAVRTAGDPMALADTVRRAVWDVDPDQPVWKIRPLASLIDESLATRRFLLQLVAFFGISAAALAVLGLYGVVAGGVAQRTREIGVRVALGATRTSVLGLVMQGGFRLAGFGIVLGLVVALVTSTLLERFLFGITARDPLSFAAAAALLAAATALACWIPGRRALRVDPVDALRL